MFPRTHANNVTLRRHTGATGHDEGHALVLRSLHAWPRAPRVRKRNGMVAIVAAAHGVVLHPSRRQVSRNTYAAACNNQRH